MNTKTPKPLAIDPEGIYTPKTAAAALGISRQTVDRAIKAGGLAAGRPSPKLVWISGAVLYKWATGQEHPDLRTGRLDDVAARIRKGR